MQPSASTQSANFSASATFVGGDSAWYDDALLRLAEQPAWPGDKERAIMEPYDYLSAHPGKEVRTRLIEAFNVWLQVPAHKLEAISRVVSMLHTASLLMDDVEDNSDLRRGIPVAHKIYGIPQTINTANYVYFKVLADIFALTKALPPAQGAASDTERFPAGPSGSSGQQQQQQQPRLSPVTSGTATPHEEHEPHAGPSRPTPPPPSPSLSSGTRASAVENLVVEEMINLHRGQGMDLFWRDSLLCPTEGEYVEMVNNKTGGLFRIALKLMITQSPVLVGRRTAAAAADAAHKDPDTRSGGGGALPDLIPLANVIGLLFQIRDDYMNLQSSQYASNKGFCEDLTEGKFSFPIIHSIRASAENPAAAHPPTTSSTTTPTSSSSSLAGPNRQILNVLKQRPTDEATKSYAVAYMRDQTRSFAYTRSVLRRLDAQARAEVGRIAVAWAAEGAGAGTSGRTNAQLIAILDALRSGWWEESEADERAAGAA